MLKRIESFQSYAGQAHSTNRGAFVKVTAYPSGAPVTVYSDDGVTPILNSQVTVDETGRYGYYAQPGRYIEQLFYSAGVPAHTIQDVQIDGAGWVSVQSFGALGNGTADDRAAIQAALNTGRSVYFPPGTYFLGTFDTGAILVPGASGQILWFDGATLKANGNNTVFNTAAIFNIDGKSNITLVNPRFESNWGVDDDRDVPHAIGLGCVAGYTRNITIINPVAYKCQTLVQAAKETYNDTFEVENVDLINGYADNCYYGTGWARTGNKVRASYKTLNAHRAYFPNSVHAHHVDVLDEHDGTVASPTTYLTQTLLSAGSFTGSIAAKDLFDIHLRYRTTGSQYINIPFVFQIGEASTDTKKGKMYDIHVDFNDRGTGIANSIGFTYLLDGVTQTTYTGTGWDRITINGYAKNPFNLTNNGAIGSAVAQTVKGTLELGQLEMNAEPTGVNNPHNSLFDSGTKVNNQVEGLLTPVVFGVTTAGGATYSQQWGSYLRVGSWIFFTIYVDWTVHTGTGDMKISGLPFNVSAANPFGGFACSIGWANNIALTAGNTLMAYLEPGTPNIFLQQVPTGGGAAVAVPVDAAGGLIISGAYRIAI